MVTTQVVPGRYERVDDFGVVQEILVVHEESRIVQRTLFNADTLWHADVGLYVRKVQACVAALPPLNAAPGVSP